MPAKPRSMYLDPYLADSAQRVLRGGRPLTPATYLAYQLHGWARNHGYLYRRALMRALDEEIRQGRAVTVRSANGGVGYAPTAVAA